MEVQPEAENIDKGASPMTPGKPHDEFFGGLIISVLVLGILLAIGFFAFLGYRAYEHRSEKSVSINDVSKSVFPEADTVSDKAKDDAVMEEKASTETPVAAVDAKQVSIAVLNGGGAKGSAGVLADSLKKAGFSNVTAGNADGDYSGVTVFYQEGKESAAKTVLADVAKKYPKAVVSKADPKRKETSAATIVVILGK